MSNIYSSIQNLYNMDKTTWQEVLAELYNLVYNIESEFEQVENKLTIQLGEEVTYQLKEMYNNGTLESLINDKLLTNINEKVDNFKVEVNDKLHNFKIEVNEELETITNYIYLKDYSHLVNNGDWTNALETAILYSMDNNIPLFIHNGDYTLSKTITPSIDINSERGLQSLTIIGESANGVNIKGFNGFSGRCFDFRLIRNLTLQNFTCWLNYHFIQYGADENKIQSKRTISIDNVFSKAGGEQISWNKYICTPKPSNYNDNNQDGKYARYPLEIMNFSAYNALMIVNKAVDENGNYVNGGVDNSAIGITDNVKGVASPTFLIDGGMRSFVQFKNGSAESLSAERENVVFEINQLGNIGIGCSTQSSDPVALGNATIKARAKYPSIKIYDQNRNNRQSYVNMSDDNFNIGTCNESGNTICKIGMNYKTGVVEFKGSVQLGTQLTWSGTSANQTVNGKTTIYVPAEITSRFENVSGGVEGQIISIVSDGTLTVEHNKEGWGNIRTNTKANVVLEKGTLYTLTRINDLWYLK